MNVEHLIQYLALTDLGSSKLFLDKPRNPDAIYEMTKRDRQRLIVHINDAIIQICQRIPVFWFSTVIRLVAGKNTYELSSKHSIRNLPEGVSFDVTQGLSLGDEQSEYYIYDTDEYPFQDNILLIGKVTSEYGKYSLNIGENSHKNAINTPRPNVIELPEDLCNQEQFVNIHYIGYIPNIPIDTKENDEYNIPLPESLKEAVATYIMYKMGLQPSDTPNTSVAISHLERFNVICDNYLKYNISNTSGDTTAYKFSKGGWV